MAEPVRLWIASVHHPAFKNGGWAWVARSAEGVSGYAGGERNTTAGRAALSGLVAALKATAGPTAAQTDAALVLRGFRELEAWAAAGWRDAAGEPVADADLWKIVAAAATTRALTVTALEPGPGKFAQAWAEFASDKAKAQGAFTAAIPKPNLAKFPG